MRYKSRFRLFFYAFCLKYLFQIIQIDKKLTIFVLYFAYMFGISILRGSLGRKPYMQKSRPIHEQISCHAVERLSFMEHIWSIGGSNP